METFAWFEQTGFSVGVREVPWVFPFILIVHSLGMGLSAGAAVLIGLRSWGFATQIPLTALNKFLPILWWGFIANLLSGIALLAGYPAKALTNPVFYLKLALLGVGVAITQRLARRALAGGPAEEDSRLRRFAVLSLLAWAGVIVAGRFLAYTHSVLLATWMV